MDGVPPSELRKLERTVDTLRDGVHQLSLRVAVLETKTQSETTARTAVPSRSEFMAAVSKPNRDEKNAAIEALKIVGPWIIALLSLLTMAVQALLRR